jgi:hypothetical protein
LRSFGWSEINVIVSLQIQLSLLLSRWLGWVTIRQEVKVTGVSFLPLTLTHQFEERSNASQRPTVSSHTRPVTNRESASAATIHSFKLTHINLALSVRVSFIVAVPHVLKRLLRSLTNLNAAA